ncbi:histidine kinase [Paenibacillus sp. UMB7766-LJ446]|uniref:cache domain-containing sensor histidine kinase n=1 Tax=Paenibacillus sp. UMB7766-LJ446 TaxID=3046313 RepID=UPI00254FFC69|nr:histidine kinase [Paenibacillus sp. UMB7766-LJ446]MDK8189900.1 histidine kinase [Paenibacillus sp. UMB7766-LJ446]
MKFSSGLSVHKKYLYLLGCLFLITIALGYVWFQKSMEAIKKNAIEYSTQLVQTTNAHLDSYFFDIERLTLPMLSSKQTLNFISYSGDDAFTRYSTAYAIEKELIPPVMLNRSDIYDISLVSESNIASSTRSFLAAEERYPVYSKLIKEAGHFKIIGMETLGASNVNVNVLTMAMRFVNTRSTRTTGMLMIDLNLDRIEAICKDIHLGKSGFVWLVDGNGKIITHPDETRISQQAADLYTEHFNQNNHGFYLITSEKEKRLVIYDRSIQTGLIMVAEVKLDELNASLIRLSRVSLVCMILFFLLLFFIVGSVNYRFSKSIILLKRLMSQAELGDLTVLAPKGKNDEMGSLYRSFNSMVTEIGRLIKVVHLSHHRERSLEVKQKEADLRALQSQINPHFLYNTLEIINSYAILDSNYKVSKMIVSLGDMLRYSVGSPISAVTLRDEMNHIRSYLQIQQERFEHFQFKIQVTEEDLDRYSGVRLMLQPIVENSFKHGYDRHKLRPGTIKITGKADTEAYSLYIHDTGGGIEPSRLEATNLLFLEDETSFPVENNKPHPIGLMNVHFRIRMIFGEPYGLWIVKSNAKGTTIRVLLPKHNQ